MLDADFEYGSAQRSGVQRTKRLSVNLWAIEQTLTFNQRSDASAGTQGIVPSLITVTTVGSHNFEAGQSLTITGFDNGVQGASRALVPFTVKNTANSTTQFTYYAKSKSWTS